jgi:hypothetical protein
MNDPAFLTILIAGIIAIVGAIATAAVQVIRALHEVHKSVNSRMDQLLSAERALARAEGAASERAEAAADAAKRRTG